MKLQFSGQIFEKIIHANFMKICPMGFEFHARGPSDGHTYDEADSRFLQFCLHP